MEYEFSWVWFFIGILILTSAGCLTVFYRQIANAIGSGVSSYERYRLYGLLGCFLGVAVMLNLHTLLLNWLFGMLFSRT